MTAFLHSAWPCRILFGRGSLGQTADALQHLGVGRALVLSTPQQRAAGLALAEQLGGLAAGLFAEAAMHTPVEITERALAAYVAAGADGVVALGGGSTTGLGKAIALRTGAPQLVIPTTYAGSEVTPILGETAGGLKTTRRSADILPEMVIYDPDLTDTLPAALSITSGLNAMAHAAEGVYAQDGSPIYTLMALEGLRALRAALPAIAGDPGDKDGRDQALYGAWLCGTVLGGVGMSIHHKLCHTLGGSLDLPHAETHAILLPHTIAFVEQAVPDCLAPVAALFGQPRAGAGLFEFVQGLLQQVGAPTNLAQLHVRYDQLDQMAELAIANPYWCPRPLERAALRALLQNAWTGQSPT